MAKYLDNEEKTIDDVIKDLGLEKIEDDEIYNKYNNKFDEEDDYYDNDDQLDSEKKVKFVDKPYPTKFDLILKKALIVGGVVIVALVIILILAVAGVIG